jgi:hypothetical protein
MLTNACVLHSTVHVYRKPFTYMNLDVVTTLTLPSSIAYDLLSAYHLFSQHLRILQLTNHDFSAPAFVN